MLVLFQAEVMHGMDLIFVEAEGSRKKHVKNKLPGMIVRFDAICYHANN